MAKNKYHANLSWMVVLTTYNIHEAHIVAGKLQSEGIPAMIHQQAGASAMGITVGAIGEITVLVYEADYELALDVIALEPPDILSDEVDRTIFGDLDDDDQ